MGRGSSKVRGTRYNTSGVLFDERKAGATYQSLPGYLQNSIKDNLKPSEQMQEYIREGRGTSLTDEWSAGLRGVKEKRKVITKYEDGRVTYTVKAGRSTIIKDGTVEQAANQVALFYKKYMK